MATVELSHKEKRAYHIERIYDATTIFEVKKHFPLLVEEYRRELSRQNCTILQEKARFKKLYAVAHGFQNIIERLKIQKRQEITLFESCLLMWTGAYIASVPFIFVLLDIESALEFMLFEGIFYLALLLLIYMLQKIK